ncbi:MAG: hypothetical protein RJA19_1069, partial [Bacteroidota bacterium]
MSRFLLLLAGLCTTLFSLGQYTMTVESHAVNGIPGQTTYRFYINMQNSTDFLSSVFGNNTTPLSIVTPSGFYNNPFATGSTADGINPMFLGLVPQMAYDSWVTIGIQNAPSGSQVAISTVESSAQPWLGKFNANSPLSGGNVTISDATGGAWYVLNGTPNGLPTPATMRTLFMQLTCTGTPSGTINAQVFPLGNGTNQQQLTFAFNGVGTYSAAGAQNDVPGCTNAAACNYDADATEDDGSCSFAATGYNCAGGCLQDTDGDGICNPFEIVGCQNSTACNFDPLATDAGSCTFPAAGYNCAGACLQDTDGDGVCNSNEVVGCQTPTACN